jgi:hypothetical protein
MRDRSEYLPLLSVAVAFVVLFLGQPAAASQIAEENFRLSFPVYSNSGTGFSGAWTTGGFNAFVSGYTLRQRSLCYPRLENAGASVSGDAFSQINGTVRNLNFPLGATNSTVYVSILLQPEGILNEGVFNGFFGFTLNGALGNDLFIGKPGGGVGLEEYVVETRGGAGQVSSGVSTEVGQPALLVLKAQFMAGPDVFTLYVNPAAGGREPTNGVVKTDLDLGAVPRIGIYSTGAFTIDEIRIGTTFADVVPTGGGPDKDFPGCL